MADRLHNIKLILYGEIIIFKHLMILKRSQITAVFSNFVKNASVLALDLFTE